MPILAIMILVNYAQAPYSYASYQKYLTLAILLGQEGAFIGVLLAFWHNSWIAGVLLLISGIFGLIVYAVYSK
jgi:hypothetical protein